MTTNKSYKKRKEKTPPPRASAYLPDFKSNSSTSHPLFRHTFFELCPDISEYVNSFKTSDIAGSGGLGGGWGEGVGKLFISSEERLELEKGGEWKFKEDKLRVLKMVGLF